MSRRPFLSVIVPVWNDQAGLDDTVDALRRQTYPADRYEVILVDNKSDPPMVLNGPADNMRLLVEDQAGSYHARNRGLTEARGDILAFTDADCMPDRKWLENAVDILADESDMTFLGGNIRVLTRERERYCTIETFEQAVCFNQALTVHRNGHAATANLIVPRPLMDRIGPFKVDYSGGDFDWCHRAAAAGAKPVYSADVIVNHPSRGSRAAVLQRERRLAGGHYKRSRSLGSRIVYILKALRPPRTSIRAILALEGQGISPLVRLKAILFAIEARLHMAATMLWLTLTDDTPGR